MTITDKVVPNLVGVDIDCGMETISIIEHFSASIDSDGVAILCNSEFIKGQIIMLFTRSLLPPILCVYLTSSKISRGIEEKMPKVL